MIINPNIKILITGGGTGGHVFPAIAIANAIKQLQPNASFLFIGAKGRLEETKVPEAGYQIELLNISGFQRDNIFKNILLPFKIIGSLLKAAILIHKFKPQVVVGVGGYASGPTMYVAHWFNIPVLIQEQNSFAGITNKMMKNKAAIFCVAYDNMQQFFPKEKIVLTGNPVRQAIATGISDKPKHIAHFSLTTNKKTLLVVGGSLGAKTINEAMLAHLPLFAQHDLQIIWQTGKNYFTTTQEKARHFSNVKVFEFITDMNAAYDAADIIISRAGAIAISELCLIGKPVILIPSPNVAEDHQTKNALALVNEHAAIMIKDAEAKDKLGDAVLQLFNNEIEQKTLAQNILKLGKKDAAIHIAQQVIQLIHE